MDIRNYLKFSPTKDQLNALKLLDQFVQEDNVNDIFILQGSAGTGKTSLIKAVTEKLGEDNVTFFLAAPTGRAAKVISSKTDRAARTIHSLIYSPERTENGSIKLKRKANATNDFTIYIIDESSMISDEMGTSDNFITSNPLLTDIIDFVKQGNSRNKIVFLGDSYQLPPVRSEFSPALSRHYIESKFSLRVMNVELTEVKRQESESYILTNATQLRNCMVEKKQFPNLNYKIEKCFTHALHRFLQMLDPMQLDKVVFLAFTNKDVNFFNNAVRDRLFGNTQKQIIEVGDVVTLHTNWVAKGRIIMKGDIGTIKSIDYSSITSFADLRFINAEVEFTEPDNRKYLVSTSVMLDVFNLSDGNIDYEKEKYLYAEGMKNNPAFRESQMSWDDKYIGSMRLRYGYASTCHKAQGGEWDTVILHPYYQKTDYRWLYTAVTRAKQDLYSYAA